MRTWIKLYTEILNDPKMGRLTDREFRVCINLFLMAGHTDHDGTLGSTAEVAWALRTSDEIAERDLLGLSAVGIVTRRLDGVWVVTKFSQRQQRAPSDMPSAIRQRVQKHRQKQGEQETLLDGSNAVISPLHDECNDIEQNRSEVEVEQNREDQTTKGAVAPAMQEPPEPEQPRLTETQSFFLSAHSAKRFRNNTQRDEVLELEKTVDHDDLIRLIRWSATKGFSLGDAIINIRTAVKNRANGGGRKTVSKKRIVGPMNADEVRAEFERLNPGVQL